MAINLEKLYIYEQEDLENILDSASDNYYNNNKKELILKDEEFDYIKDYLIIQYPMTKYKKNV
tara:strand:+ start:584 stop:772 length:189 start_codon:yes stop_codon:yes gene_type:complete